MTTDLVVAEHGDLALLTRSVRDLAQSATVQQMQDIRELFHLQKDNLKRLMGENGPMATDPVLVINAFKMIADIELKLMEAKRRQVDTLIKARVFIDPEHTHGAGGLPLEQSPLSIIDAEDPLEGEPDPTGGTFGGFGNTVPAEPSLP